MAERRPSPRVVAAVAGGLVLVAVLVVVRGPVALLALGTLAVVVTVLGAVVPLQRADGVDWDWLPQRAQEPAPEPGIATLRRLLDPGPKDTEAPRQLHDLVGAIADDRLGRPPAAGSPAPYGSGDLGRYLAAPPRRLSRAEVETLVTELEHLTPSVPPPPSSPEESP
ncbi:hypothetical protein [Phycicoccus sp.]|uniref:hypothetical protein n=1 Tax=Phycicoccus sp. TaxID=1902410 RepID=UPI002C5FB185|nr:hypothetical protein [Phycicoccus sp.]HMM93853.1 hypothetical protein [Phycicoccus sp.]